MVLASAHPNGRQRQARPANTERLAVVVAHGRCLRASRNRARAGTMSGWQIHTRTAGQSPTAWSLPRCSDPILTWRDALAELAMLEKRRASAKGWRERMDLRREIRSVKAIISAETEPSHPGAIY